MRSSCRSLVSCLVAVPLALAALLTLEPRAEGATPDGARHARSPDGLFWFMHISDTHVGANIIEGPKAKEHLTFALNDAVTVIKPSFVWNTGDLEDGSGKIGIDGTGIPTSGQSQTQWDWYKQIYQGAGMKLGFYFDLPGNHDAYGDDGLKFYLANSLWGASQKKTWMDFKVVTSTGEYGFFGLNSTNNYFKPLGNCCPGFLDGEIAELDAWLQKNAGAKLVFVAAHHSLDGNGSYPTAKADQVRALLKANKAFYIHGDVHEYKEYVDTPTGVVVNEIGSLGKSPYNNIGVGVVDHDAFVYRATDVEGAWPFAIVTSPVSATLRDVGANPWAYSVCKNRTDNPFRAVTFSYTPPTKVTVKVGNLPEVAMAPAKGSSFDFAYPVWQAEVDTRSLVAGLVDVTVRVEAGGGTNSHQITAKFDDGACAPIDEPTDAGAPDAQPVDAGSDAGAPVEAGADAGADTGVPLLDTAAEAGCSCRTAPRSDREGRSPSAPIAAGALVLVLARTRRRR
jgi:hypothetical protein